MSDKTKSHPELTSTIACKTKYGYQLFQAESYWDKERGYSTKRNKKQIGFIKAPDGIGFCQFNDYFLDKYPEFKNWRVKRVGVNKFEYFLKTEEDIQNEQEALISKTFDKKIKVSKFGSSLFMQQLFLQNNNMQILKSLLSVKDYELLELILMTLITYGSQDFLNNLNAFKKEHLIKITSELSNIDKNTLENLYNLLDSDKIIKKFTKKKVKATQDLKENLDLIAFNLMDLNFLIYKDTKEIFSIEAYSDLFNDVSTFYDFYKSMQSLYGISTISCLSTNEQMPKLLASYQDNNINFIANCNFTKSKNIKAKVIEYGDVLMYCSSHAYNTIIESIEVSKDRLTSSTYIDPFIFTKKKEGSNIKDETYTYVHYIFNSNMYKVLLDKTRDCLDKINNVYGKINDNEQWAKIINKEMSISTLNKDDLSLIEKGVIYFNPTLNEYFINIQKFNEQKGYIESTKVICSNCIQDVLEVDSLYNQIHSIECAYTNFNEQLGFYDESTVKKAKLFVLALANELIQNIISIVINYKKTCKDDKFIELDNGNFVKTLLKDLDLILVKVDTENNKVQLVNTISKKHLDLFKYLDISLKINVKDRTLTIN